MFAHFRKTRSIIQWKEGPSSNSAVPTWSLNGATTGNSNAFIARPIKHWRKQLQPTANSGKTGIGMPMDLPGGSVYLGATLNDCSSCSTSTRLKELIPNNKNVRFDTSSRDASGNCVACNPEANIIKSAISILKKNYYSDRHSYLHSRCVTYDQKLSTTPISGNTYFDANGKPVQPSNSSTGSQVWQTQSCLNDCIIKRAATTIYKPNNQQYSQQGAVTSSSRLARLKYNTITDNGASFRTAYGAVGANAGKYQGTSESPYFIKSKEQSVCVPFRRNGIPQKCI
jgi:hypothetical protein